MRELGIGPVTSLNNIYMIDGRMTLPVNTMVALLRSRGVTSRTIKDKEPLLNEEGKAIDLITQIEFCRDGLSEIVTYSWKDATAAQLTSKQNWQKYPRAMMWARCYSMGARRVASDLLLGLYETSEMIDAAGSKELDYEVVEDNVHIRQL